MTVHYLLNCYNMKIIVKQVEGEGGQYNVNIQSNNNPLSFGNTLYTASSKEKAIRVADQLCTFYSMARMNGYHLQGKAFLKPDTDEILAEYVLMRDRSRDELHAMLTPS